MNDKKRVDSADVVELAYHSIHKLVAEGWIPETIVQRVEHGKARKHGARLPTAIELTVRFLPSH